LAVRDTVPAEEQLSLLPFKVSDLAGFRVSGIVPGRAVMLGDAAADAPGIGTITEPPHLRRRFSGRAGANRRPRDFRAGRFRDGS
jgi:hypothetical protein